MKKLLSMVLVLTMAVMLFGSVSVSAETIDGYNEVGKLTTDGYTSGIDAAYGKITTGGAADLQGTNGTPGIFIQRTALNPSKGVVNTIAPKTARISLKKGYIYYTSVMAHPCGFADARLMWVLNAGTTVVGGYYNAATGFPAGAINTAEVNYKTFETNYRPRMGYGTKLNANYTFQRVQYSYYITDVKDAEGNSISETGENSYFSLMLTPSDHIAGTDFATLPSGGLTVRADDIFVIGVPANDLTADAYPAFNNGVAISANSATPEVTTLSVTASAYDVNINIIPDISYQWQQLSGGEWSDIEGATLATFTPGKAQSGKSVRCMLTASSKTTQNGVKTATFATAEAAVSAVSETISFNVDGATASYSVDGGDAVSDLSEVQIPYGSSVKLTFAPEAGKIVNSVSYNGASYPVTNNEVILTITASGEIAATAEERTVTLPKVSSSEVGTPVNSYTFNNVTGKSAVIFINNDIGYGYTISETGCILIAGDNQIELKNENSANDRFGIRVIGNAFIPGTTYVFRPYIKISGEDNVYGADKQFKFEEE